MPEAHGRYRPHARELLPDGLQSKDQFLFSLRDDALDQNPIVGMIWFAVREGRTAKSAFIYDLRIREALRGKGYGRKAMQKFENVVQEMGIGRIGLNVFGHNHAVRSLYEKLGYRIGGNGMNKTLGKG